MRTFEEYNPCVLACYFLMVSGIGMFSMNPIIIGLSLGGAVLLYCSKYGCKEYKSHLYSFGLFLIMALINPFVSHNGVTVLFVMNHNPITLEAFVYGVVAAAMILAVMYWFRTFTKIMTSDKLLYIFGSISPKLALILSMAIRYVPLFGNQVTKVNQAQKAMGLYKEDNAVDTFRGGLRVFSVMVTWALENGIITADSMTARGYGIGKRSGYKKYKFRRDDVIFLGISLALFGLTLIGLHGVEFNYYPAIVMSKLTMVSKIGFVAYGGLILLPILVDVKESIKWKYLKSII